MVVCPQCKKKLELFDETNNATDEPECKRYTCNKCGIFVTIEEIFDDEVLESIGYKENDIK